LFATRGHVLPVKQADGESEQHAFPLHACPPQVSPGLHCGTGPVVHTPRPSTPASFTHVSLPPQSAFVQQMRLPVHDVWHVPLQQTLPGPHCSPPHQEGFPMQEVPGDASSRPGASVLASSRRSPESEGKLLPSSMPPSASVPATSHTPSVHTVAESTHRPRLHVENASHGTLRQSGSIEMGIRSRVRSKNVKRRRATMQPV
jgi:hypothetical protein